MRLQVPKLWALARALYVTARRDTGTDGTVVRLGIAELSDDALEGLTSTQCTAAAAAAASCVVRQWNTARRFMPPYLGVFVTGSSVVIPADAVGGMLKHDPPCVCDVWRVDGDTCTLQGSITVSNPGGNRGAAGDVLLPADSMGDVRAMIGAPAAWDNVRNPAQSRPRKQQQQERPPSPTAPPTPGAGAGAGAGTSAPALDVPEGNPYTAVGHPGRGTAPPLPYTFVRAASDMAGRGAWASDIGNTTVWWASVMAKFSTALAENGGVVTPGVRRAVRAAIVRQRGVCKEAFTLAMWTFLLSVYTLTGVVLTEQANVVDPRKLAPDFQPEHWTFAFRRGGRRQDKVAGDTFVVEPPRQGPLAMWVRAVHGVLRVLFTHAFNNGVPVMPTWPSGSDGGEDTRRKAAGTMPSVGHGVRVAVLETPDDRARWLPPAPFNPDDCVPPAVVIRPFTAVPSQYVANRQLCVVDGKLVTWLKRGCVVTSDTALLRDMAIDTALATVNTVMHAKWDMWRRTRRVYAGPTPPFDTRITNFPDVRVAMTKAQHGKLRTWAHGLYMANQDMRAAAGRVHAVRLQHATRNGGGTVGRVDMGLVQALSIGPPCFTGPVLRAVLGGGYLKWKEVYHVQNTATSVGVPMYGNDVDGRGLWDVLGKAYGRAKGLRGDARRLGGAASHHIDGTGEKDLKKDPAERWKAWCKRAAEDGICPYAHLETHDNGEFVRPPDVDPWLLRRQFQRVLDAWGIQGVDMAWPLFRSGATGWDDTNNYGLDYMHPRSTPAVVCQTISMGVRVGAATDAVDRNARTTRDIMAAIAAEAGVDDTIAADAVHRVQAGGAPGGVAAPRLR